MRFAAFGLLAQQTEGIAHLIPADDPGMSNTATDLGNCVTTWHGGESYR
jgi:hypothetical protein